MLLDNRERTAMYMDYSHTRISIICKIQYFLSKIKGSHHVQYTYRKNEILSRINIGTCHFIDMW